MNSQNSLLVKIGIGAVALLLVIGAFLIGENLQAPTSTPTPTPTPVPTTIVPTVTSTPTVTELPTVTPTPKAQAVVYDNKYMKVTVPAGWSYTTTAGGAINIMKNGYILYINPNFQQASGITGGRFSDIGLGSPSVDTVVTVMPSDPCGTSQKVALANGYSRYDLYVNKSNAAGNCNVPTNTNTVWYFAYVIKSSGGYITYYTKTPSKGYVITMSYNSHTVNDYPVKGSKALTTALTDMANILKTLQLKQK